MTQKTLEAIKYKRGDLQVLDQLLLPFETAYEAVPNTAQGHHVIKTMKVRGAPAIAIVAALSLAVELNSLLTESPAALDTNAKVATFVNEKLEYLKTSRPTAVNLFEASERLSKLVKDNSDKSGSELAAIIIQESEEMLVKDVQDNKNIGKFGCDFILSNANSDTVQVLTHCNTGSLATAGWGTALGIVRDLNLSGKLDHCFCTETRPYNQGSRLTAYELVYENIPSTLVCDSMASALLKLKNVKAIIVGADRVAANGDTANKIGTYQLAITAAYHKVMFIVAAPLTTIDMKTANGDAITIEERAGVEVTSTKGRTATVEVAAPGIGVWNPAFDVVPASLITAIVTNKGVITKNKGEDYFRIDEFIKTNQ
ncbi:S-methyl-5-thioribose-1-phosphate isomerase [Terramyces sp. JEL0728]|nr:S-methyl-5-thioribose-1-phosphate isomerase [Terramyces sp. JEL0728]